MPTSDPVVSPVSKDELRELVRECVREQLRFAVADAGTLAGASLAADVRGRVLDMVKESLERQPAALRHAATIMGVLAFVGVSVTAGLVFATFERIDHSVMSFTQSMTRLTETQKSLENWASVFRELDSKLQWHDAELGRHLATAEHAVSSLITDVHVLDTGVRDLSARFRPGPRGDVVADVGTVTQLLGEVASGLTDGKEIVTRLTLAVGREEAAFSGPVVDPSGPPPTAIRLQAIGADATSLAGSLVTAKAALIAPDPDQPGREVSLDHAIAAARESAGQLAKVLAAAEVGLRSEPAATGPLSLDHTKLGTVLSRTVAISTLLEQAGTALGDQKEPDSPIARLVKAGEWMRAHGGALMCVAKPEDRTPPPEGAGH